MLALPSDDGFHKVSTPFLVKFILKNPLKIIQSPVFKSRLLGDLKVKMEKLHEECGIFGIIADRPINAAGHAAAALLSLQHRGQQSAGIVAFDGGKMIVKKDLGLVTDIFGQDFLDSCAFTHTAAGHVRYSAARENGINTTSNLSVNAQPITVSHKCAAFSLSHNGSLTNAAHLRQKIAEKGGVFYTTNDSEIVAVLIVEQCLKTHDLEKAVFNVMDAVEGAFSIIVGTEDKLVAARDKNGFRPLCMGRLNGATVFASESCALDCIGAEFVRDIAAGELVSADKSGQIITLQKDLKGVKRGLCVFEYVYFARPDSFIDGISVHAARMEMGRLLFRQKPTNADMVCGVPDSGISAAYGYAEESGIPYGSAFIKNRYVGRTFIAPTQPKREQMVGSKLSPLKASILGKRIVLVDDSIVRGTTSANIIKALRVAGAKEVHMRISSPPFKYPCYFGTDVDSRENLIANHYTVDEICRKIGADSLVYLPYKDLMNIKFGRDVGFCGGCFDGKYPIKIIH